MEFLRCIPSVTMLKQHARRTVEFSENADDPLDSVPLT